MARNDARDAEIFRRRCSGVSIADLAREYNLSTARIHEIMTKERGKVSMRDRESFRTELSVQLDHVRASMQEIMDGPPGADVKTYMGDVVHEQDDHGARIYAARVIVAAQDRQAKLLGLNSADQAEVTSTVRYEMVGVDPDEI